MRDKGEQRQAALLQSAVAKHRSAPLTMSPRPPHGSVRHTSVTRDPTVTHALRRDSDWTRGSCSAALSAPPSLRLLCSLILLRFSCSLAVVQNMPREIVTVQLGQCGNQSAGSTSHAQHHPDLCSKWVPYTGRGYVLSTALTRRAFSKIGPPKAVTGKMSSFTRRTMSTIFLELS